MDASAPPKDEVAEACVLGACLLDPSALDLVWDEVKPADFYSASRGQIYETMLDMRARRVPVDKVTLCGELKRKGLLDAVGGSLAIDALTNVVPTSANAGYYSRCVSDKARLYRTRNVCIESAQETTESRDKADEILERVERRVFEATERRVRDESPSGIGLVLQETFKEMAARREGHGSGVPTGFEEIDRLTNGLTPGELTVIAGRPGQGKTTLLVNLVRNVVLGTNRAAPDYSRGAVLFSLETTANDLALNMTASMSNVNTFHLRKQHPFLSEDDEHRFINAAEILSASKLHVCAPPSLSAQDLRARARRLCSEHQVDLIAVDYLQLMTSERNGKGRARHEEVADISRSLKALAMDLKVPVIALSQLNRKVEDRTGNRPRMSDLRESGSIEADAALILLIHREEYYTEDPDKRAALADDATVIIAKNRYGPTGDVDLYYERECCSFSDARAK